MTWSEFPLFESPELVHFLVAQETVNQSVTNEPALMFVLTFMALSFLGELLTMTSYPTREFAALPTSCPPAMVWPRHQAMPAANSSFFLVLRPRQKGDNKIDLRL
jgi:hypothetical protein